MMAKRPQFTLLLLLLVVAVVSCQGSLTTMEDIVAKEQEWAKKALERRGHVFAGSDYLDELLNMDHHLENGSGGTMGDDKVSQNLRATAKKQEQNFLLQDLTGARRTVEGGSSLVRGGASTR